MVTPTVFHVGYTIVKEELSDALKKNGVSLSTVKHFSYFMPIPYLSTSLGGVIRELKVLNLFKSRRYEFYFPVNGELSWIYSSNVLIFIFSMIICFLISKDVQNKSMRSFLLYYNIFTSIGYVIGIFNLRIKIIPKFDYRHGICDFSTNPIK